MIPGGLDPKKMQAAMRQMGIKSEDIEAARVTIETPSGNIVIDKPQVVQITVQGQKSFQISGDTRMEKRAVGSKAPGVPLSGTPDNRAAGADDVKLVMERAGCTDEQARAALEKSNGDIAEAILSLTEAGQE